MAYVKKVKATIQIDKLIFSCHSTIDDNFTDVILYSKNSIEKSYFQMNNTQIARCNNYKSAYKHSYKVSYFNYLIGILELGYKGKYSKHIKFTVDNTVFYNGTLPFLPFVLSDLYLEMTNISQLDIAIDNYNTNSTKKLYNCIRNEKYKLQLNKKYVYDMDKIINEIVYWTKGSRKNQNMIKSISAKSAKGDKEFTTYDKLKEIETKSHKYYTLDYHKLYNPDFENLYRDEVRLDEDILKRHQQKFGKITLQMLLDKQFLYKLFQKYEQSVLVVKDSKDKLVKLYPTPSFESRAEAMLQHHLPAQPTTVPHHFEIDNNINELNFLNENNLPIHKIENKEIKTIYNYKIYKRKRSNMRKRQLSQQTKDKISMSMRGSRNPNFGKPLSDDHREKIRQSMFAYWNN